MTFDRDQIARNLARYGPFAATEQVLVAAVRAGADRQETHEWLRELSLQAWESVRREERNPLADMVAGDTRLTTVLPAEQLRKLMDAGGYVGTAAARARALAVEIRTAAG